MDKIIHFTALLVLLSFAALVAVALYRQVSLLRFAGALQEQSRERFEAELDRIRQSNSIARNGGWSGNRQFRVVSKTKESEEISSFFLQPIDEKPLPAFLPGQFLTFELNPPGAMKPVVRCYSLSDCHNPEFYRVTIKRVPRPQDNPGYVIASNYFHDQVSVGTVLKVRAPSGAFVLAPEDERPIVLLAGGVGLTPVLSMLLSMCDKPGAACREVWFFYGVRDMSEHVMKPLFEELAKKNPWLRLNICYSQPGTKARPGVDYHHEGRVTIDLLKKVLPSSNYSFYICGPPPMMNAMVAGLKSWGVPEKDVHYEAFGQASAQQAGDATMRKGRGSVKVKFTLSGNEQAYGCDQPLIKLVEQCKARVTFGCRTGNCGICKTLLEAGDVTYAKPPGFALESGYCLPCVGFAKTDLALEA